MTTTRMIGDPAGRLMRLGTAGHLRQGRDTLLAQDFIEGTAINTWLWSSTLVTMTAAQAGGVLTLNASGLTTASSSARLTSNKPFPLYASGVLRVTYRVQVAAAVNATVEWGLGLATGTSTPTQGIFYRLTGSTLSAVLNLGGVESSVVVATGLTTTSYLQTVLYIEDDLVRVVGESADGALVWDTVLPLPATSPALMAVSHLPAHARVMTAAVAPVSAPTLKISGFDVVQLDLGATKDWPIQLASTGRSANIRPDTYAQASQLGNTAPSTSTPTSTTCAYPGFLGGDFSLNVTAASENFLGVFSYTVPSPYTLMVTDVYLPPPVTTGLLGGVANVQQWAIMIASSTNPTTAGGQRYSLGFFSAPALSAAGTLYTGLPLAITYNPPLAVLPGQSLLVLVKQVSGILAGAARGNIDIRGYYE